MIKWYKDKELSILFSIEPQIRVRYPHPDFFDKEVCNKPFLNKKEVEVVLEDFVNEKNYEFIIPEGYCWDGATIPRFFWRFIGSKTDNRFLIPSLVHDVLCENHSYVENNRYFSTIVFERLLYVSGVSGYKRWMMKHSVDNFQKFCKWR